MEETNPEGRSAPTVHTPDAGRRRVPPKPASVRPRAAARALREGRPSTTPTGRDADPAVLDLVEAPFESVADAHDRLSTLEAAFRERADRRGAFLSIYARVTGAVGDAIDEGRFADPAWVADYLVAFADLYREALCAYEREDLGALPDPWQVAFEAADRGECLVAQAAVLGVNAHVNHDLAYALDRVGIGPDRSTRYDDHCAVNRVLREVVDEVQASLAEDYAPGLEAVDEGLGRVDETVALGMLVGGREAAWRSAVALASRFRVRRRFARWYLRVSSTGLAYVLLAPTRSASVEGALRDVEDAAATGNDGDTDGTATEG